jgi:hypothetical protein
MVLDHFLGVADAKFAGEEFGEEGVAKLGQSVRHPSVGFGLPKGSRT